MSKVLADISMSLDGFITDPDASVGTPLEGNDPGRLHDWRFGDAKTDADAEMVAELYASTGAFLVGMRMFDARGTSRLLRGRALDRSLVTRVAWTPTHRSCARARCASACCFARADRSRSHDTSSVAL
jgi:hypothetical protein